MMVAAGRGLLLSLVLAALPTRAVFAQDAPIADAAVAHALAGFTATDQKARAAAFYELIELGTEASDNHNWPVQVAVRRILESRPAGAETLTLALIRLADLEDDTTARTGRGAGDGYGGDLVGAVAALRDPRALPALLRHIESGAIADRGIAALGDEAVAQVIALTSNADVRKRNSAVLTLGEMFQAKTLNAENRTRARDALTRVAAKDASPLVRQMAEKVLKNSSGAASRSPD